RLTVSHYENNLNRFLGGKTSPSHPGKIKRYRCIEEYVDIDVPPLKSVLELKAWHKVAPLKEERSMNLKMDDRRSKKLAKKTEESDEVEHTPTVGIALHEQSRSQDTPLHRNRSRRRHHLDYYPMEYYDDYDYMPVYSLRRRRHRLPYAYRMKRMLPGSSRLDDPSSYLLKSPSLAPEPHPRPQSIPRGPLSPSLLPPTTPSPIHQSPRPLRSQLTVRRLSSPTPLVHSPQLTFPKLTTSTLPPTPILLQKEKATPETCDRMTSLASQFGITDVLDWASNNCVFLQGFAPGRSCQEILDFIATCKN
ncbi:hypothetical protein PENTCL1PPCAC_17360, partial [Pristionchus entomophagus]